MSEGCFNKHYDYLIKEYKTWSDTNLDGKPIKSTLTLLKCNNCGGTSFSVAQTDSYETSARCVDCGKWFIVHTG